MFAMIVKMSALVLGYTVLTVMLTLWIRKREMTPFLRVFFGVIYGGCAVFSTHYGVEYSHMILNVRDLGPLVAGLFFDPVSGIIGCIHNNQVYQ